MRRHARFSRYAPPLDAGRVASMMSARTVAAARLQPSYTSRFECWIDVIFAADGEFAVAPFVQIDGPMLLVAEASPFLWPAWLPLGDDVLEQIESFVEPWLASLTLLDSADRELLHVFSRDSAVAAGIARARGEGFLGAAPAERVLESMAPSIYAQRFAKDRSVGIRSATGANGAAVLSTTAASVRADLLDPSRAELARRWFGIDAFGSLEKHGYDVTIGTDDAGAAVHIMPSLGGAPGARTVSYVKPAFAAITVSFDPSDAEIAGTFSVRAPDAAPRRRAFGAPAVIGGSAGRIGIIVRDDGLRAPGSDVDEAQALCAALRAQDFDASVTLASAARAERFDLIHLIGHRYAEQMVPLAEQARERGIPIVVTPQLDDAKHESAWGSSIENMLRLALFDEASGAAIESSRTQRRLNFGDGAPIGQPNFDTSAVANVLRLAGAVIASSEEEAARLRSQFAYQGPMRTTLPVLESPEPFSEIGTLCGSSDYVLVHSPVDPSGNQVQVARAAAELDLPCVMIGTVENGDYYQSIMALCGSTLVWLPSEQLSASELASLYAGARVFADFSWSGRGGYRMLRAASYGTALAASTALPWASWWPGLAETGDPASFGEIARAVQRAWDRAPAVGPLIAARTAVAADPLTALRTVLGAYAEAAAVKTR